MVREDLSLTQKDKFMLQAKVTELKNSMKTLLQQNQQLKLDLKHGKMKKVGYKGKGAGFSWSDCPNGEEGSPVAPSRLIVTKALEE